MNRRKNFIVILLSVFMAGCVSPYYPNITKYENLFVVDGQLTNLTGPYEVKLSRTFKYDGSVGSKVTGDPVTGAQVKIIDNTGLQVQLKEIKSGIYSTADTVFRGVPGNSYKIQIKTNDEVFESDFETLKTPAPIDKLYWEYNSQDNEGQKRVKLLIDTHDPTNNTRYYAWDFEETWKFKVPLDVTAKPEWKTCYKYNSSTFFNIGTTIERNNDIMDRHLLQLIYESSNRLFFRYSILAKQYSFTEQTYDYFKNLIKLNQNQGTLFDVTPYSLVGNIKSLNNKEIPVLGYFVIAGASQKRIFIDRSEVPREFSPTDGFNDCSSRIVRVPASLTDFRQDHLVDSLMGAGYTIYEQFNVPIDDHTPGWQLSLAKPQCFNCTLTGDSKIPDFWTEKK